MTTAKKSLSKESKTVIWMPPQFSGTSSNSSQKVMPNHIREWLMSSPQDSPASPLVSQESKPEQMTPAICGPPQSRPFALLDPDTASWKTCQDSLLPLMGISEPSFKDFPKQGMMLDGACWVQTMLVRHTRERGCGLWPTPDGSQRGTRSWEGMQKRQVNLQDAVKWWPTPIQGDAHLSSTPEVAQKRLAEGKITLSRSVQQDKCKPATGQLNPDWVCWLMGWPIGWTSPEPLTELLWLDWSVDPADMEAPQMWTSIMAQEPGNKVDTYNIKNKRRPSGKSDFGMCLSQQAQVKGNSIGPIPRVATDIKDRVNRLKAIGNGIVPQCMEVAWKVLTE